MTLSNLQLHASDGHRSAMPSELSAKSNSIHTYTNDPAISPHVSVVIPCRNEEKYIARCLDSILANDYPLNRLEILVLDGLSSDGTREILKNYTRKYPFIRVLDNLNVLIPSAMNAGLAMATGNIIMKIDAHSLYGPNHISECVKGLLEFDAENVGGIWKIIPGAETAVAEGIVIVLQSRFGSGNALVKTGVSTPTWSDSVAFGCYRKALLKRLGGFNEALAGSSDMDMNRRIRAAGGKILLLPNVVVDYFADPTWNAFWRHTFADGVWIAYVLKFGSRAWSWRHWVPFGLLISLLVILLVGTVIWSPALYVLGGLVAAYAAVSVSLSIYFAVMKRSWRFTVLLPPTFFIRHFAHALGVCLGLLFLLMPGIRWKGRRSARV